MMKLKGKLSIHKYQNQRDGNDVSIEITDDKSGCMLVHVEVSLNNFAEALFSRSDRECAIEYFDKCPVGKDRQWKDEEVEIPSTLGRFETLEAARTAIKKFEVDGWKGDPQDVLNNHRRTYLDSQKLISRHRVQFVRYVDAQGKPHIWGE